MALASPSRWRLVFTWLFGFLLPAGTLFYESLTGFCAQYLFDPLPSFLHQGVVALVPLGFLFVLNVATPSTSRGHQLPFVLGGVFAISLIYTLPFVPLLPAAFVALIYFGLGFLPLAPLLALLVTGSWIHWLSKQRAVEGLWRRLGWGALVGLLCFVVADGQRIATHVGLGMAASDDAGTRARGLRVLRAVGDEGTMLRQCLQFKPQSMLYSVAVEPEDARRIYFRVHGKVMTQSDRMEAEFLSAFDRVGEALDLGEGTWPRVEGLHLKTSEITAELESQAPLAYLQWEMVFGNARLWPAEALAEIALPTGAQVSRVTLWIEGEPREAAFGGRTQVTDAYEDVVVVQRKDPLLVTTAGPDRVRMRAFPVPPGGELRMLLGITAPLDVVRSIEGRLDLPYFSEHNFSLAEGSRHHIRLVDTGRALRLHAPLGLPNPFQLNDQELASFATFVAIHRDDASSVFWHGEDPQAPRQMARLIEGQRPRPRHLVAVVDGSATMAAHRQELAATLEVLAGAWPAMDVVWAGDTVETRLAGGAEAVPGDFDDWLEGRNFVGGRDNVPALLRGIELAAAATGGAVLWIGGVQPLELTPADEVRAFLDGIDGLPPIFALPTTPGAFRQWDAFEVVPPEILPRYGTLSDDVRRLPGVDPEGRAFQLRFALPGEPVPPGAVPASAHLARRWAGDEVQRLLRRGDDGSRQDALRLAVEYQLVTPVSGAVVLETAEQYAAHDLEPVDPFTVPTIPEPEVWALLLVALGSMVWLRRRRAASATV